MNDSQPGPPEPSRNRRRGVALVLAVAILPCVLCSGMAALIAGQEFASYVLVTILTIYALFAFQCITTWLAVRTPQPQEERQRNGVKDGV